jgi:hypothetical protein
MKKLLTLFLLVFVGLSLKAQNMEVMRADGLRIRASCAAVSFRARP